jgi:hypothetical protein
MYRYREMLRRVREVGLIGNDAAAVVARITRRAVVVEGRHAAGRHIEAHAVNHVLVPVQQIVLVDARAVFAAAEAR